MSASIRTTAVVLRRTNYGEADRILQLITPLGRKSVIAKGVRREKSRLAGGIELFAVSDVVISQGKGDLGILTSARLSVFYRHILEDYETLQFGYEVIRQIARVTETVDEPEWYELLTEVLEALDTRTISRQLVQIKFYLRYASLLGRELSLVNDIEGRRLDESARYSYDLGEGGLRRTLNGELGADHIKFLRLLNAKPISVVAQIGGIEEILPECWHIAREHAAI